MFQLLLQDRLLPSLLACSLGILPLWGSFVVMQRVRFWLVAPAVILVMVVGGSIDVMEDKLASALHMYPWPVQEQMEAADRYMKEHPSEGTDSTSKSPTK